MDCKSLVFFPALGSYALSYCKGAAHNWNEKALQANKTSSTMYAVAGLATGLFTLAWAALQAEMQKGLLKDFGWSAGPQETIVRCATRWGISLATSLIASYALLHAEKSRRAEKNEPAFHPTLFLFASVAGALQFALGLPLAFNFDVKRIILES